MLMINNLKYLLQRNLIFSWFVFSNFHFNFVFNYFDISYSGRIFYSSCLFVSLLLSSFTLPFIPVGLISRLPTSTLLLYRLLLVSSGVAEFPASFLSDTTILKLALTKVSLYSLKVYNESKSITISVYCLHSLSITSEGCHSLVLLYGLASIQKAASDHFLLLLCY